MVSVLALATLSHTKAYKIMETSAAEHFATFQNLQLANPQKVASCSECSGSASQQVAPIPLRRRRNVTFLGTTPRSISRWQRRDSPLKPCLIAVTLSFPTDNAVNSKDFQILPFDSSPSHPIVPWQFHTFSFLVVSSCFSLFTSCFPWSVISLQRYPVLWFSCLSPTFQLPLV